MEAITKSTLFTVTKDEQDTEEDAGTVSSSRMHSMYSRIAKGTSQAFFVLMSNSDKKNLVCSLSHCFVATF